MDYSRDCHLVRPVAPVTRQPRSARELRQQGYYDVSEYEEAETSPNGTMLYNIMTGAAMRRHEELNDLVKRLNTLMPVLTEPERHKLLCALGEDPTRMRQLAVHQAKKELDTERRRLATDIPTVTTTGGDIAYKEVAELYKLVNMIKDKVLLGDAEGGLVLAEGATIKDLASFTGAVNNLYGTFMKCKDQAKLHEDINKITEALKQAMKEMPQEYVNKFMEILTSFDN